MSRSISESHPSFQSSFLLIQTLGGSRWWLKYLGLWYLHRRLGSRSGFWTLAWPIPSCCRHLGSKLANEDQSLFNLSLLSTPTSLCLSNKKINYFVKNKQFISILTHCVLSSWYEIAPFSLYYISTCMFVLCLGPFCHLFACSYATTCNECQSTKLQKKFIIDLHSFCSFLSLALSPFSVSCQKTISIIVPLIYQDHWQSAISRFSLISNSC